jgi:hypothetical protein
MSSLRNRYWRIGNPVRLPIQRTLTDDGTLAGDNEANVDGSVSPVDFFYQAEPNRQVSINKIGVVVRDGGNTMIDNYGAITGPLPNGTSFFTVSNSIEIPLTPIIKSTADFFGVGASAEFIQLSGTSRLAVYNFTLFQFSDGIGLNGDNGDIFGMRVNDDLTELVLHQAFIDGNFQFINGSPIFIGD